MRQHFVAALALTAIAGTMPVAAQTIAMQYQDDGRYSRGYDDRYEDDDPFYDRGSRYGRDDPYDPYDGRGNERYDDDLRRQRDDRVRRYLNDDGQRDVVVKRLTKRDKRCLRKHSTYDPESGTYSDGYGGRRRCKG